MLDQQISLVAEYAAHEQCSRVALANIAGAMRDGHLQIAEIASAGLLHTTATNSNSLPGASAPAPVTPPPAASGGATQTFVGRATPSEESIKSVLTSRFAQLPDERKAPAMLTLRKGEAIIGLAWHGWGSATATGVGKLRSIGCTPNCAEGKEEVLGPATVALSGPVEGVCEGEGGVPFRVHFYTHVAVTLPGSAPTPSQTGALSPSCAYQETGG